MQAVVYQKSIQEKHRLEIRIKVVECLDGKWNSYGTQDMVSIGLEPSPKGSTSIATLGPTADKNR